jgi:hypothetical protein
MGKIDPSEQRLFGRIGSDPHCEKHARQSRRASFAKIATYESELLPGLDGEFLQSAVVGCCKLLCTSSECSPGHSCS